MTYTFHISGKSLLELRKEYGTGAKGFYDQSWYLNAVFENNRPEAGDYEIDFGEDTKNKTFKEQKKEIREGFEVAHPAVVAEALLLHFKATGERLFKDYWVRTSLLTSDGHHRLAVGRFDSDGLDVSVVWDGVFYSNIGVSSARKSTPSLEPRPLDPFDSLAHILRFEKAVDKFARAVGKMEGKKKITKSSKHENRKV